MRSLQWLRVVAPVLVLSGCSLIPGLTPGPTPGSTPNDQLRPGEVEVTPPERMRLDLLNETTIGLVLVVNGAKRGTVVPGDIGDWVIAELGPLPWGAEARTASGRLLASLVVHAGDTGRISLPTGIKERAVGVRVELSCGGFVLWSGDGLDTPEPAAGGAPGDCDR